MTENGTPHLPPVQDPYLAAGSAGYEETAARASRTARFLGSFSAIQGIRGWNKTPEASYDNPDLEFVAAHADEYVNFYGRQPLTTDAQKKAANELIESTEPAELWRSTGFPEAALSTSPLQSGFLKENDPQFAGLTGRTFKVVEDEEGSPWLLKLAGPHTGKARNISAAEKLYRVERSEQEAMAANVAGFMGYPVAETRLVTHEASPWVAYRYIEGAVTYRDDDGGKAGIPVVTDTAAVALRPVFNFVAGSFGDGAHQAIIDSATGKYYAQDLNMVCDIPSFSYDTPPAASWEEFLKSSIVRSTSNGFSYGALPRQLDAQTKDVLTGYIDRLRALDVRTAAAVISPRTPLMKRQHEEYAKALAERAKAMVALYDEGFFEKSA